MSDAAYIKRLVDNRLATRKRENRMPEGWWYYAKKKHPLFPGIGEAIAPPFLRGYYDAWSRRMGLGRKLFNALTRAAFNAWLPGRTKKVAGQTGKDAKWQAETLALARSRFADPSDIDKFRTRTGEELDGYLRGYEWNAINKALNPRHWQPDCPFFFKADFYLLALIAGLPIAKTYAMILDGKVELFDERQGGEIVVKPSLGSGGLDVQIHRLAAEDWQDDDAFICWLKENIGTDTGDWIVQRLYRVHPDLAPIALNALPTARISTLLNEKGEPEIVTSVLRFAAIEDTVVDNVCAGGAMAPIDLETGRVGIACLGHHGPDVTHHPVTGEPVEGTVIPDWEAIKALALESHLPHFADYKLVGWDIGLTDAGPVIIEGNGKPCYVVAQRGARAGIGETRFGELIAWHLEREGR